MEINYVDNYNMEQTEINTDQLRQLLDKYEEELAASVLERRGRSQMLKDKPVEELQEVTRQLISREKEQQAIVGIAKMLLGNNEILSIKNDDLMGKKHAYSQKIKFLKLELDNLKQSEKRYEELSGLIIKAEEQLLDFDIENKRLKQELSKAPKRNHVQKHQEELEEVRFYYKEQLKNMQKTLVESEKNHRLLQEKLDIFENEFSKQSTENTKLSKEAEKYRRKVKEMTRSLEEFEVRYKDKEELLSQATGKHNKAVNRIKELEEEIYMMQSAPIKETIYQKEQTDSLMDELAELGDADTSFSDQRSDRHINIAISQLAGITIPSKRHLQNKDPCEEFFVLATQSVKMNSPFMDAICKVSAHALYKKAVDLDVPMHEWYKWIEDELNSTYSQTLDHPHPNQLNTN